MLWATKVLNCCKADVRQPIVFPDTVTVLHKLVSKPDLDTSSFLLEAIIVSHEHQRAAARCFEDIVVYDYRSGKKSPLEPFMVSEFADTYDLQKQTREKTVQRIKHLQNVLQDTEALDS
jgi:hypothetical protein